MNTVGNMDQDFLGAFQKMVFFKKGIGVHPRDALSGIDQQIGFGFKCPVYSFIYLVLIDSEISWITVYLMNCNF